MDGGAGGSLAHRSRNYLCSSLYLLGGWGLYPQVLSVGAMHVPHTCSQSHLR